MKSKAVTCVLDMLHERKASEDKGCEYGTVYTVHVQYGCRQEVRREGQI